MRPRIAAASAATLITAASISPITAHAAGQNTIFVNGASSTCTNSGTGTATAPYCTIQAAADAANPGDLVSVTPGNYTTTTITRSGTASDPIIFTGNGIWTNLGLSSAALTAFDLAGASHVRIQNFALNPGDAADALVGGGADITFRNDVFRGTGAAKPSLHVTDAASAVTVLDSNLASQVLIDGGSTGTVLTTDRFFPSYSSPMISVVGAANTAITSDTINGCGPSISVTGSATGTAIENNVIYPQVTSNNPICPTTSQALGILVDSASAPSTTEDYNDVYATGTGSADYNWAGTAYSSAAGLYAAVGQGKHDDNSQLGIEAVENSPLINSADSAATGEQPVDISGHPRVLDPLVTPSGAGPYNYYDRGAVQYQDPLTKVSSSFTSSVAKAPVGANITLTGAFTDTWSDTFDYQFKLSNGTTVDAGTSGTAVVSFSTPGVYTASLYVIPTNGATAPTQALGSVTFSVVPQAPLVPQLSASAYDRYSVSASDFGTTDAWSITGVTLDFGDGTPVATVADGVSVDHIYAKAGTYKITETVTDQNGASASTSTKFTTNALVAGTLINSNGLPTFTPANSTGIVQTAVTSMPDDSSQLLAATTSGTVELATGASDASVWKNWQALSQPGVTAKWVGIAGMPNGSSQLIEITSSGTLLHTVRNANGTWQAGWGSPARSTGFAHAAIAAMPDGSAQLVAVTTTGVLLHNIRYANGSWQGWGTLAQPGIKIVDASISGEPNGMSQLVEVTSAGVMKHNIRYVGGAWQGWGVPVEPTGIVQATIACSSVFNNKFGYGSAMISVVTSAGGMDSVYRNSDGSWSSWFGTTSGIGNLGTAADTSDSYLPDGSPVMFTVTGS